ncbi:acetoacetate--CoA ligase [Denitratisoma oestradiolicum]|uniref:Acetoacetyl-coenzyme A synthetase n=1 Tax=Denitratisoma oestradiolicum TaxID=311182 RepID=A0A6S6XYI0_9PROT|nr:acetoacetate--CoA ligase [Denitratisoma oestradiolicum]TWO81223.1 acetoacetate--CoA ligase [Denitratisoma oestradiolicum]CAB1367922.1 Acetoacetyl-coenzyme A synthetase [Denitratisoma oestradiolicum]
MRAPILWSPTPHFQSASTLGRYLDWLADTRGLRFDGYEPLWQWSVSHGEDFWQSLWDFFEVRSSRPAQAVLTGKMPECRWFPGAQLNYAENVFRQGNAAQPALIFCREGEPAREVSWRELQDQMAAVAGHLKRLGVKPGDRVAAYLANTPEAVVAFLATASIGAVWSCCSPDFGADSVIDRFRQIEPKVLFAVEGYQYGGKSFDCRPVVQTLRATLDALVATILIPHGPVGVGGPGTLTWAEVLEGDAVLEFEQVAFDHPLWIVYSSGTTGLPKALVHGHGGIVLEELKWLGLHLDVRAGERFFWFSTTGWVMWNVVVSGLLLGATIVLYDGNPGYPDLDTLWRMAEEQHVSVMGAGAPFLTACMKAGLKPGATHDLSRLRVLGSTGAPLPPEAFDWVYGAVKADLMLASSSGGTEVCTAFLGSSPLLPVRAGELQCRLLGVKAAAFDEAGQPLIGELGELVLTAPIPSMPICFWNDPGMERYRQTYFDVYPEVWRHGDWVTIHEDGSAVIHGRSDSTLKRMGVRMGTSDLYRAVEEVPEVADSLVVGVEPPGRDYLILLFVVLKPGLQLDAPLRQRILDAIRLRLTPRHVPDQIHQIDEVPMTLTGKKLEVPVKRLLAGEVFARAVNLGAVRNPESLNYFLSLAAQLRAAA